MASAYSEFGCSSGETLHALRPSRGLGVDLSPKMVARARERHPGENLEFDLWSLGTDGQSGGEDGAADIGNWNLDER